MREGEVYKGENLKFCSPEVFSEIMKSLGGAQCILHETYEHIGMDIQVWHIERQRCHITYVHMPLPPPPLLRIQVKGKNVDKVQRLERMVYGEIKRY